MSHDAHRTVNCHHMGANDPRLALVAKFTVRLLGSIEIRDAAGRESETLPRQPKRLGLLSYLAIARPRGFHRRDKLVALFWPEATQEQARHSLTQALHVLRTELGESAVVGRGKSSVAIDETSISCDVVEFELAVGNSEHEKALELYRGDLLEGLFVRYAPEFERWLDDERTRLRERAAGAAWALAHQHISAGRLVDAERTAQRALQLVATDESEARRFIQSLADAGDRAAALRFYEKFAQRLRSEYDIEPDPATVAVTQALVSVTEDQPHVEDLGEASAAKFAGALADPGTAVPTSSAVYTPRADRARNTFARYPLRWSVGLVAVLSFGILLARRFSTVPNAYHIALPDSAPLAFAMETPWGGGWTSFVVSSREDFLVYVADRGGTTELWYHSLVDFDQHPIPGTDAAYQPLLSPDDEWVAFVSGNQLKKTRVDRPGTMVVAELQRPFGAHWGLVDTVAIVDLDPERGMSLIDMRSGAQSDVPRTEGCAQPHVAPRNDTVLCSNGDYNLAFVSDLQGRVHRILEFSAAGTADGRSPLIATDLRVVDDRYLLFVSQDGWLKAAALDQQYNVIGRPANVEPGLRIEGALGVGQFQVTESGNLFFVPGEDSRVGRFVKADGVNPTQKLPIPPVRVQQFDVSADGTRMVVVQQGVYGRELWVYNLVTGSDRKWLTAWDIKEPRWTQDGERVIFNFRENAGDSAVILIGSHTEPGDPDTLLQSAFRPSQVSAAGLLVGQVDLRETAADIAIVDLTAEPLTVDTIYLPGHQGRATISPDGRWLAYLSTESDRDEVFLEPYPSRERRYSVGAGLDPLWLDSTTLVYRTGDVWYKVRMGGSEQYPDIKPEFWFRDALFVDTWMRSQAAHPDGSIIYVQGTTGRNTASFIRVVPKWMEQVKRAVAEENR
ncbi:MAG: BTAD domain-containing putative transcriptional regulator [Gemmatimonadales bacterium]